MGRGEVVCSCSILHMRIRYVPYADLKILDGKDVTDDELEAAAAS